MSPKPAAGSGQQAERSGIRRTPAPESRPKQQTCTSCGSDVLEAWTTGGLHVTVDAPPLSAVGELHASLAGRATYTWHLVPDHLARRYPLAIRWRPAGTPRQTVHAGHRCGDTWPALQPGAPPSGHSTPGAEDPPPY